MDDRIRAIADYPIRRACGFVGLGTVLVLLSLSFDLPLAFRVAAVLLCGLWAALSIAAQRAPQRDVRRTEFWALLRHLGGPQAEWLLALPAERRQALLGELLRERLLWHADRAGLAALALAAIGFALLGLKALRAAA